ncbi:MAG: sugar phosphate isomerase/epimerase [Syntrophales bacterium]|jgi:sugar phosphate isomerase/epimerase|nr:sugar phosphate isomerase/epimerase [Syntrophales bacterium]
MLIPSPSLPALKGRFPFRLGTTSYVLPDAIAPNVRFTGPFVDEVELVLFESRFTDNLPTHKEIEELNSLAREYDLSYNVHLPTDVFLGHPDSEIRQQACNTILGFYERTLPLNPTLYVLHLEKNLPGESKHDNTPDWQGNLLSSLEYLLERGMQSKLLGIENIDYPFRWIYPLIREFTLNVCLDIGHLLAQQEDLTAYIEAYGDEIAMVHLHGVAGRKDHRSLQEISHNDWHIISEFLINYRGGVSLEVFSLEDLTTSMGKMSDLWGDLWQK